MSPIKIISTCIAVLCHGIAWAQPVNGFNNPLAFVPPGYVVTATFEGDLNKDGQPDTVLLIKGTDKNEVINDEDRGELDRNRRGLIIVFNNNGHYEQALVNPSIFASENEDGGVYFAPYLTLSIKNGGLLFSYDHGRYGHWSYHFRYQHGDFELIGYDASQNRGPVVLQTISINFSTQKVLLKKNINQDSLGEEDDVFEETWKRFTLSAPIRLSTVKDIDDLFPSSIYPLIK